MIHRNKLLTGLLFVLILLGCKEEQVSFDCQSNQQWTRTEPPINLRHIFCGEINKRGRASGFHSRPGGNNPANARIANIRQKPNRKGVYTAQVEIRQSPASSWKQKFSTFYPDSMNRSDVLKAIVSAYNSSSKRTKWRGASGLGFQIEGYKLTHGKNKGSINTAYPIYVRD